MGFLKRFRGRDRDGRPLDGDPMHAPEPDAPAEDDDAPGWDAIRAALDVLYPGVEPHHWGTVIGWRVGGPDPLDGVSVYANDGPPPHWHYVSYGLSELYAKESENRDQSGWGIELTFRLARPAGSDAHQAPIWVASLLQNLARHVFDSGNVFYPGHHVDLHGPIQQGSETALRAALFATDPQLPPLETPNGLVHFVQVVGLALDEYDAVRQWNADRFLDVLRRGNPLLVTDLERGSVLAEAGVAAEVGAGIARDGSSMDGIFVDVLALDAGDDGLVVTVGAIAVPDLQIMLRGRIGHGRRAFLNAAGSELVLAPGDGVGWHRHGEAAIALELPAHAAAALADALRPATGEYRVPEVPGVTIVVDATIIGDQEGREIDRLG